MAGLGGAYLGGGDHVDLVCGHGYEGPGRGGLDAGGHVGVDGSLGVEKHPCPWGPGSRRRCRGPPRGAPLASASARAFCTSETAVLSMVPPRVDRRRRLVGIYQRHHQQSSTNSLLCVSSPRLGVSGAVSPPPASGRWCISRSGSCPPSIWRLVRRRLYRLWHLWRPLG